MSETKTEAKGFFLFFGDLPLLERLSDEERGRLLTALTEYALYGRTPTFIDRYLYFVFDTFASKIDSYYKIKKLTRPEPKTESEPIDEELAWDESKLADIKVYSKVE